jgi:hypothetical protein
MNTILDVIVIWALSQILFIWFCARLVTVRELDMRDYRELEASLARRGLDAHTDEPRPILDGPPPCRIPPAGVARA